MTSARFIVADVFDGLATIPDGSVDLVVTSPPFLALRSYLPADHPDKGKEIGSEPTPAAFIDVMLAVTAELRRVLAPHGSICVELGDTYAGSGGAGGDYGEGGWREGQERFEGSGRNPGTPHGVASDCKSDVSDTGGSIPSPGTRHRINRAVEREGVRSDGKVVGAAKSTHEGTILRNSGGQGWPLAKSKTLIPELYRIALAYGRNPLRSPLTAREMVGWFERIVEDMRASGHEPPATDLLRMMNDYIDQRSEFGPYREYERWRVRNNVTWCRPNPPVGALGDKWRPATSDVVVACISDKRYWDDLATRREAATGYETTYRTPTTTEERGGARSGGMFGGVEVNNPAGAPLLDYWEIPPGGYKGSHYAVFPPALVEPLVKAMAPPRVCRTCGEPSRRIVGEPEYVDSNGQPTKPEIWQSGIAAGLGAHTNKRTSATRVDSTLGWSDCGHDNWRPAHILDPFAGSGTTGVVATGHGHDVTLIDLDERNRDLARERIGPFLFEEQTLNLNSTVAPKAEVEG